MKYLVSLIILIVVGGSYGGYQYIAHKATQLPATSPAQCEGLINAGNKQLVVALGDSITHAKVSGDYVQLLDKQYSSQQLTFINAGINSRLAFNALEVIDSVVACDPSVVTILIGTNDVLATASRDRMNKYMDKWQLPQTPNFEFYKTSVSQIIDTLKTKTSARIAIFSIPLIGETPDSKMNKTVAQYNGFIKELAMQRDVTYLPLNEHMWQYVNAHDGLNEVCDLDAGLMEKAIAKHYVLGQSWDEVSAQNNLHLLTDCVHLNDRAAEMVANLAGDFIAASLPK